MTTPRWDRYFLNVALTSATMSKDPSTRVGAVIIGPDREIRSAGFNGLPRGIGDTADRLHNRDMKMELIVHAEHNAILNAARIGVSLKGCTLYLAATDDSGGVWGGPPCTQCTLAVIQAGIQTVVSYPFKTGPSRWRESIDQARRLLDEAEITYREFLDR